MKVKGECCEVVEKSGGKWWKVVEGGEEKKSNGVGGALQMAHWITS